MAQSNWTPESKPAQSLGRLPS